MNRAPSVALHVFAVYTEPSRTSNLFQCGLRCDGAATRAHQRAFRPVHPYGPACAHLRQPRFWRHGRSLVAHTAPCRGTRHPYRFLWWPVQPPFSFLASRRLLKRSQPLHPTMSPRTCARAYYMRRACPRAPLLAHLPFPFFSASRRHSLLVPALMGPPLSPRPTPAHGTRPSHPPSTLSSHCGSSAPGARSHSRLSPQRIDSTSRPRPPVARRPSPDGDAARNPENGR